ncbi:MAG TPA: ATP-binding protein [Gaiellaceae bacterium]|jgi:serine/threonine-protein kinase RsbW
MTTSSSTARSNGHARAVRLTIPAKAEYITLVRLALSGLSQLRPLSEETLGDLKLAVTEACSNSVRHAYQDGREGAVEVLYELHSDRLVVEVSDDGEGFTVADQAAAGAGALTEGGLGIAIIRELADELELGPGASGKGSRLRFVKFIQD